MAAIHECSLVHCINGFNHKFPIKVIAATTLCGGIGFQGKLPWPKLINDLKHFQHVTTKTQKPGMRNAVVMGRKTWSSIPPKFRPLSNRINFVLSSKLNQQEVGPNVHILKFYEQLFEVLESRYQQSVETIFLIGGEAIYQTFIEANLVDTIYLTRIGYNFDCDKFFPKFPVDQYAVTGLSRTYSENSVSYDFITYKNLRHHENSTNGNYIDVKSESKSDNNEISHAFLSGICAPNNTLYTFPNLIYRDHEELQYLDMITRILNRGVSKEDRTGVGTISIFGENMRFSLRQAFPLLTTKRVFWRGVIEELLWFIAGDTNGRNLLSKNVKIWEKNGSRAYLDSIGLTDREEHDLGPIYGFQWRHFGADYVDMHTDYTGKGVDQLKEVINKLKTNSDDRRIILSSWNPKDLSKMALPPCHIMCQFYVSNGELSCLMFQRSCDMGLGVPFNIASYSLLTCMIAQVCKLRPGEFIYFLGDAHIYKNHIEVLKTQLQRLPRPFPTLLLNQDIQDIDKFTTNDIKLCCYDSHGKLNMDMAV